MPEANNDFQVNENEVKTFLYEVTEEEARLFPEYDGVNDIISLEDALQKE